MRKHRDFCGVFLLRTERGEKMADMHHTIRLKLKTTADDEAVIERRFRALAHVHNVVVKHVRNQIFRLEHDPEYKELMEQRAKLSKEAEKLSADEKKEKKSLNEQLQKIRSKYGLTEYSLYSYIKVCGRQFKKQISSTQVRKEASYVWRSAQKYLFSNGKQIHFKKQSDFSTIGGKTNQSGARFDAATCTVNWIGLSIPCVIPKREAEYRYHQEALKGEICYCEISRLMFPNGWHYYAIIVLKGEAPKKERQVGTDTMGIDPGVSTIAAVSDSKLVLQELAPDAKKYNRRIEKLQRYVNYPPL